MSEEVYYVPSDKMTEKWERQYCIKSCVYLGDFQVENIRKMQQTSGNEARSITQIKGRCNHFKDDCRSGKSESYSGRPSTCINEIVMGKVKTLVIKGRRIKITLQTN